MRDMTIDIHKIDDAEERMIHKKQKLTHQANWHPSAHQQQLWLSDLGLGQRGQRGTEFDPLPSPLVAQRFEEGSASSAAHLHPCK